MRYSLLLFVSTILASPVLNRRYDLDHNGVPDICYGDSSSIEHCLGDDGSWSSFAISSTAATESAKSATTASSPTPTLSLTAAAKASSISPPKPSSTVPSTSSITAIPEDTATLVAPDTNTVASAAVTATLPDPSSFKASLNSKWTISKFGTIYSTTVPKMGWDNGRTSTLAGQSFWNFGDVLDVDGLENGFSMGAAFYSSTADPILGVDMKNITNVNDWDFAKADPSDPVPNGNTPFWGQATSNIAEVTPGVGIGFVWEFWRDPSGAHQDRGLGIIKVVNGPMVPIATRTGPLVAGPEVINVGWMTILNAEGYIYTYSNGGATGIVVGRAKLADAFDATKYEFLKVDGTWSIGIPLLSDMSYGVQGAIHSDGQGSIMYNSYFKKYMLFTNAYEQFMNFYASDTPYGPWSAEYSLLAVTGYAVNVHPEMSSSGQELFLSSGIDNYIYMYKVDFNF